MKISTEATASAAAPQSADFTPRRGADEVRPRPFRTAVAIFKFKNNFFLHIGKNVLVAQVSLVRKIDI